MVNKFKAADEPQILALEKEESLNGSTKQAPEEMHAMNAETGGTDCEKCQRFGKDECWTHSPHHCGKCKKRGKTCLCVKKARYLAKKERKATEQEDKPQGDLSSMIASMEALTVALNTKQNQGTKTEGKEVRFEAGEEELGVAYFGMVEVPEAPNDEEKGTFGGYFTDDTNTDNPPERVNPKPTQPHDNGLDETQRQYSAMLEAVREMEQEEEAKAKRAEQAERDRRAKEEEAKAKRAEQAERDRCAKEASLEKKESLETCMQEMQERLSDYEARKVDEAITAQVIKDTEE